MTLEALQLDDLNWRDLVDGIRGRIVADSAGEWTLHAPVDPGVTLLELFAYLFEQRVYWLDQISEPLARALLSLVDVRPHPTRAASTVLAFTPDATGISLRATAGLVMRQRDREAGLRITLTDELAILPILSVGVQTYQGDRTADLQSKGNVSLLPLTNEYAEASITFSMPRTLETTDADSYLALLFELDAAPGIAPEWSHDAQAAPMPADLDWSYRSAMSTGRKVLTSEQLLDGTRGLRRSGIVRIRVPADWQAESLLADGGVTYRLWLSTDNSSFSSPPILNRLVPNAVAALQYHDVSMQWVDLARQTATWLRLPDQQLQLYTSQPEPLEDQVFLRIRERDGEWYAWHACQDFSFHGPADRVYQVNRQLKRIHFGDGLNGRIPVLFAGTEPAIRLCYLAGGGETGNFGANLHWISDRQAALVAINPESGAGGSAAESILAARARAATDLHRRERAVTAADFERLAENTPGIAIARAHAAIGYHPAFPCHPVAGAVTVFILPWVPRPAEHVNTDLYVRAPVPDPGAISAVSQRLNERRLVTTEVYVCKPKYRPVSLVIELVGIVVSRDEIESTIQDHLTRFLDPLTGGERGAGWPFGEALRPSGLIKQVQQVIGQGVLVQRLGIALDGKGVYEDCRDVTIARHELVFLQSLDLKLHRQARATGGLR